MAPLFTGFRFGFGRGAAAETGGAVNATGGTKTTYGSRTIHTFTTVGDATFTLENGNLPAVQIMVVAGGGSGGSRHGGAGGGGGMTYVAEPNGAINAGTYKVRVGAGGTATYAGTHATKGDWSFFGPTGTADWPTHVMAEGGGSGGCYSSNGGWSAGANGGGASGESSYPNPQQAPNSPAPTAFGTSVSKSGADGGGGDNWGTCPDCRLGGGGGGQAGNGGPANPGPATGGAGFQYQIAGDPNNNYYY